MTSQDGEPANEYKMVVSACKDLLDNKELTNVVLTTSDGGRIDGHLDLLSIMCPYIERKLCSLTDGEVYIPDTPREVMCHIVDFLYTGRMRFRPSLILHYATAARTLEIPAVAAFCQRHLLSRISVAECLSVLRFARSFQYGDLEMSAREYVLAHFEEIREQNPDFATLPLDDLTGFLSHDKLNVRSEESVFWAISKWLEADTSLRAPSLPHLLRCLRMGHCGRAFLQQNLWENQLFRGNEDVEAILLGMTQLYEDLQSCAEQTMFDLNHPFLRPRVPYELLFVTGGWSAGSATNILETYDTKTKRWFMSLHSDTVPRAYHGMVWHGGHVYVLGGFDGHQCFSNVRRMDPARPAMGWEEVACMHVQRCYVTSCSHGGFVYALGGYDGHRRNRSCEKYDAASNQWTLIRPMIQIRSDASADVLHGKIYIAGGFNGSNVLNSAEFYDPESDTWTEIDTMLSPRSGVRVVGFENHLYVIGGFNGTNRLSSVERYDRTTRVWSPVASMQGPRSNFAAVVMGNLIYAVGGFNGFNTIFSVETYDPKTNTWNTITDLNINRSALCACVVHGIPNAEEYSYIGTVGAAR